MSGEAWIPPTSTNLFLAFFSRYSIVFCINLPDLFSSDIIQRLQCTDKTVSDEKDTDSSFIPYLNQGIEKIIGMPCDNRNTNDA